MADVQNTDRPDWAVPSKEAIEYGRRILADEVARLKRFAIDAAMRDDAAQADRWSRTANWIEWQILGGGEGCVIRPFDARWLNDEFRSVMAEVRARVAAERTDG